MTIENLRAATAALRTVSDRPFNLDFFSQAKPKTEAAVHERTRQRLQPRYSALGLDAPPRELPDLAPAFDDDWLSLLLELRPAVVRFHFDVPGAAAIAALRSAGIILISTATTVAEAPLLEVVRLDAVIAQGWEAGGRGIAAVFALGPAARRSALDFCPVQRLEPTPPGGHCWPKPAIPIRW